MRPLKVDRIEFTPCRAQAAADAAVLVNGRRAASEAPCSLGLHLLRCQAETEVFIGLGGDPCFSAGDLALRVVKGLDENVVLVEFYEIPEVAGDRQGIARTKISGSAVCRVTGSATAVPLRFSSTFVPARRSPQRID